MKTMPFFLSTPKSTNCVKYLQHNPKLQFSLHPTETSLRKWHLGAISLAPDGTQSRGTGMWLNSWSPSLRKWCSCKGTWLRPPGQTIQGLWNKQKSLQEQDSPELGALHLPSCLARKREVCSSTVGIYFPALAHYVPQDVCASIFMLAFTA